MQGDATAQSLGGYLSSMIGSSPCHPCFHQDSLASACAAIAAVLKAEGRTSANRNDKSLHLDFTQRYCIVQLQPLLVVFNVLLLLTTERPLSLLRGRV
jgi:hypothetical protein